MLQAELKQLDERVQRLIATCQQLQLERQHAVQERDRLRAANDELREHIAGIVRRLRTLEASSPEETAP